MLRLIMRNFRFDKAGKASLTFNKLTETFASGGSFSTSEILAGVQGSKTGYTLKNITSLNPSGVASVSGSKPNWSLSFTKVGNFTATIVLEHPSKADVTITSAEFEITKAGSASLTFNKLTEIFASGGSFSTSEILAGVQGSKTGYTLKNITSLNPSGVASVSGTKPNFVLNFTKAGTFTATLVLEHPTKGDATINNAEFQIDKAGKASLTFNKLTETFASGGSFSTSEILAGVQGSKTGYTLKNITSLNPSGVASVSGSKPNWSLSFTKVGNFTATLVLEHPSKADVTITSAEFEITKAGSASLTFNKLTEIFASGGSFSTSEILAGVQGSKTGYTLKNITSLNPSGVASVSGSKPNWSLSFTKVGNFTATIVLEHPSKADVTITSAEFEITKAGSASLTFNKLTEIFASGGSFSTSEILAEVQGAKTGYTLKEIKTLNPSGVASVSGSKPNLSLNFIKAGTFTATLVLEHPTKADATINNAEFGILLTLTITGLSNGNPKVYDGTATPQGTPVLNGIQSGDDVAFADGYPKYTFADNDFSTTLTIESINVETKLKGADASKYQVQALTGLTQKIEVGVNFNAGTKTVTGLKSKYTNIAKIGIPASIDGTAVDNIGNSAFIYKSRLREVYIDTGVKNIDLYAFLDCRGLTSVTLPNSLTHIKSYAFAYCNRLTSVTLPNSLIFLGPDAFSHSVKLVVKVITSNQNKIMLGKNAFGNQSDKSEWVKQIQVPAARLGAFQGKWDWRPYASIIVGY